MEPRQLGYLDNEGNYITVNEEEQHAIGRQIEERRRMEEENVNPQPGSKMEEEQLNDIIEISKEEKKEGETNMESEIIGEVLKEMEKQEEFEKKIQENNKIVPWLHTTINKTIWKKKKEDTTNGVVPQGPAQFYKQAAIGRAINIQFSYETINKYKQIEIKSYEGKKSQGIEFKKEENIKYIGKTGQFNESEMISSRDVNKTVIKILIEYKTSRDDYPVYYLMTIDKWNVRINKIKEIIDPMLNRNLGDRTFLPDEYKNEPKEFNIEMYKKNRVTVEYFPYVQTEEEMQRNYRPRPLITREQYYKMPDEIQEKKNKWLEKRKELLNDIKNEREKKRKSVKPRKRFSDIKNELMTLEEKKKIIKKYDDGIRQLQKELINIDMNKDDSGLTTDEKELAIQKRFSKKEEIKERIKEIKKKRNEEPESKVMINNEKRIRGEFLESIKDEEEIDMMPKYEMLKVDMKKYKKGNVFGYILSEDKVNMTKERYEDLKQKREERMKYLEMQEEISKSWTEQDINLYAEITNILNQSGELVDIMEKYKDLNDCNDEQDMKKLVSILSLYEKYVNLEDEINEIAKNVLNKMKELQKQKEELEMKYEKVDKANKYIKRYNTIKEELEGGGNIIEEEDEEYSIMEESEGEENDKAKENRAIQWAEQKTHLFIPEMLGYTEADDFYSTSNKLEIKPAGTTITNKKGETKKLENETINLDININKGEKKTRIGIFVTKNKGYITIRLDSGATEEFIEILKNGSIKQVIYTSYIEVVK